MNSSGNLLCKTHFNLATPIVQAYINLHDNNKQK